MRNGAEGDGDLGPSASLAIAHLEVAQTPTREDQLRLSALDLKEVGEHGLGAIVRAWAGLPEKSRLAILRAFEEASPSPDGGRS